MHRVLSTVIMYMNAKCKEWKEKERTLKPGPWGVTSCPRPLILLEFFRAGDGTPQQAAKEKSGNSTNDYMEAKLFKLVAFHTTRLTPSTRVQ